MNPLLLMINDKMVNAITRLLKLMPCLLLVLSLSLSVQPVKANLLIDTIDPNSIATWTARVKAGHFLAQATMGGTQAEIDDLADRIIAIGEDAAFNEWIDDQFSLPYDSFYGFTEGMVAGDGYTFDTFYGTEPTLARSVERYSEIAWWDRAIQTPDQLRFRVAWALMQVMVTAENFSFTSFANVSYYDMLTKNAFGNYRTLLEEVTYHPAMGYYLSSLKSMKGDDSLGVFADENYAREILQLFSMGVYELNMDGSYVYTTSGSSNAVNLALGKSTSQSSTTAGGVSSRAVDGNTSGYWSDGSITHTQTTSQPWWEVDLGGDQAIGDIILHNRLGYESRLSDFSVQVIDAGGVVTFSQSIADYPDPLMTINANGALGSRVRVQLNGAGVLSLAEVEIFEEPVPRPVENYTNDDIKQFAKVFTGLTFADENGAAPASFLAAPINNHLMAVHPNFHDTTEKTLLRGVVLPAGQTGSQDITDALDTIAATPSVAPFMSMRLIQRMTSSNPSANYIQNVSSVWTNTSGDMKSVVRAILMDPEARDSLEISSSPYREDLLATNVALGKSTTQSSTSHDGVSSRAVDGNTSGYWSDGSITHTATTSQPWWEVDLGGNESISDIILHNRLGYESRLSDFSVQVIDASGVVTFSQSIADYPDPMMILHVGGALGSQVRVQLNGTGVLSLAEVEVYKLEAAPATVGNLAQGKPTSQSSTAVSGVSSRAVDGNSSGEWSEGSVTHTKTESQPWWEVDLGSDTSIGDINIFNRTGSAASRLSNFTVSVINSADAVTYTETISNYPDPSIVVNAGGASGSKIRIQLNGTETLSLAEVEVFAPATATTIHVDTMDPLHGKIKEPLLMATQLLRYYEATSSEHDGYIKMSINYAGVTMQQPFNSPSVFNHYSAEYAPASGPLADALSGLVLPESELLPVSFIPMFEGMYDILESGEISQDIKVGMQPAILAGLENDKAAAVSVESLIAELNAYLMYGTMPILMQEEIAQVLSDDAGMDYNSRVSRALAIILSSADYAVVH